MVTYPNPESPNTDIIGEYAEAIGFMTIYWASLENALLLVIEALLQCDELTARCIGTSIEKASTRAALIQRLVLRPNESPSTEWADCMTGLCNQISNVLGPERNRLIHDDWTPDEAAIKRTNLSVKIGKPASREAKALIQTDAAPSHVEAINTLTTKVVDTMVHITIQAHFYNRWKKLGQLPNIPEQAIRLSKGLPATDPQSNSPEWLQPLGSFEG